MAATAKLNPMAALKERRDAVVDWFKNIKVGTGSKSVTQAIGGFFTMLARSRILFWIGYVLIAVGTVYVALVKALFYSRYGIDGLAFTLDPTMNELMLYGHFVVPILAYVFFAMPMDTIPGKGKAKEFLGDALVAVSFFFLFKLSYTVIYCVDIFVRGNGTGISAYDQMRISFVLNDVLYFGIAYVVVILFIRWLMRRNKP